MSVSTRKNEIVENKAISAQKKGNAKHLRPFDNLSERVSFTCQKNQNFQGKTGQEQAKEKRMSTQIKPNQAYLNLREASQYLGIGESTAQHIWPSWEAYGVIPSRFPVKTLKFKKSELDQMLENLKVRQCEGGRNARKT